MRLPLTESPETYPSPLTSVENQSEDSEIIDAINEAIQPKELLEYFTDISNDVIRALYNEPGLVPTSVTHLKLIIKKMDGIAFCTEINDGRKEIHLSSVYCTRIFKGGLSKLLFELNGVLFHETVHVYQHDGSEYGLGVPHGLIEGIADYFRMMAGGFYINPC